ncbi:MAG: hypothetical protein MI702_00905, partial [Chlorobiales bacterium]|nr:hypothetical protein [Chlorobiales bacterium]
MKSKALEVNLSDTRVDVIIDPKYSILLEIVSSYVGILNRMNTLLEELSHPYKNWEFISGEARHLALHYFYLYQGHEKGDEALTLFVDIFLKAFEADAGPKVTAGAADNLMLFLQHIATESGDDLDRFLPVLEYGLNSVSSYDKELLAYFVRSYYQPDKIAR